MNSQSYFEMADVVGGLYGKSTWTPLWAYEVEKSGDECSACYNEEIFRVRTLLAPLGNKERLVHAPWRDVDSDQTYACVDKGHYCKPGEYYFDSSKGETAGEHAVFNFSIHGSKPNDPVLNQDLVMALHLVRDGDKWVRPEEANAVIIRQVRNENEIVRIEILTEVLKDYLCARNMGLYIEEFRHRQEHTVETVPYPWSDSGTAVERYADDGQYTWKGWLFNQDGYKRVEGQLWKQHWVNPACFSSRIWGDGDESIEYIVASDGTRHTISTLDDDRYGAIYLFFDAHIISRLRERQISVEWVSRDVLDVTLPGHTAFQCGLSKSGNIFVIAADIARLEVWAQRIWARENLNPEDPSDYQGHELFRNQMCCEFLSGSAPESVYPQLLADLESSVRKYTGTQLWNGIDTGMSAVYAVDRMVATDEDGLVCLTKHILESCVERLDVKVLRTYIGSRSDTKDVGALKLFEMALSLMKPNCDAHALTQFMRSVNYMRQADSHLMSLKKRMDRISEIAFPEDASYYEKGAILIEFVNQGLRSLILSLS